MWSDGDYDPYQPDGLDLVLEVEADSVLYAQEDPEYGDVGGMAAAEAAADAQVMREQQRDECIAELGAAMHLDYGTTSWGEAMGVYDDLYSAAA